MTTVSKIDLLNKQFSRRMFGYSRMEVDQFMLELAEVLGDAADSQKVLQKKIKQLEQSVKEYRQRDETLRDTLMSTQKMVDDLKVTAGKEAQLIIDGARTKADTMVQKGHNRPGADSRGDRGTQAPALPVRDSAQGTAQIPSGDARHERSGKGKGRRAGVQGQVSEKS